MSDRLEKIRDMLRAHNDGVYLFSARDDIPKMVEFMLGVIAMKDSDIAVLKEAEKFYVDRLRSIPDNETGAEEDEIDRLTFALDMAKTDALIYANKLNQANDAITVLQTLTIALNQRINNAIITLQDTGANDDKQGLIYSLILSAIRILEGKA